MQYEISLSAAAAESGRTAVNANIRDLAALGYSIATSSSPTVLTAAAQNAIADVAEIQLFLESLNFLNQQASTTAATSTAQLNVWQEKIAVARKDIDSVIYTILSAEDAVTYDQKTPVASSSVVLDSQLASHEAAAARAIVAAESAASSTAAKLSQLMLRAPATGTIAAPAAPARLPIIGQTVASGQPIVSLIIQP